MSALDTSCTSPVIAPTLQRIGCAEVDKSCSPAPLWQRKLRSASDTYCRADLVNILGMGVQSEASFNGCLPVAPMARKRRATLGDIKPQCIASLRRNSVSLASLDTSLPSSPSSPTSPSLSFNSEAAWMLRRQQREETSLLFEATRRRSQRSFLNYVGVLASKFVLQSPPKLHRKPLFIDTALANRLVAGSALEEAEEGDGEANFAPRYSPFRRTIEV